MNTLTDLYDVTPDFVKWVLVVVLVILVIRFLVLNFRPVQLDSQRLYDSKQRALGRKRAGGRCEHNPPSWFRCKGNADEADHIYPWSKGGATTMMNLQYLCKMHNGKKSAWVPTRFYIWRLERRRKRYFPADQDRKVSWRLADKPFQYDFNLADPGRRKTLRQEIRSMDRSARKQPKNPGGVPASFYVRANRDVANQHPEVEQ